MPDFQIRIFQLDHFMRKFIPNIYEHFKKNEINSDIFMSKMLLTIFSSFLPFETLCKVWDVFLIVILFYFLIINIYLIIKYYLIISNKGKMEIYIQIHYNYSFSIRIRYNKNGFI